MILALVPIGMALAVCARVSNSYQPPIAVLTLAFRWLGAIRPGDVCAFLDHALFLSSGGPGDAVICADWTSSTSCSLDVNTSAGSQHERRPGLRSDGPRSSARGFVQGRGPWRLIGVNGHNIYAPSLRPGGSEGSHTDNRCYFCTISAADY